MLYNILIINMAYVEIDKYKFERNVKFCKMLKEFTQFKIVVNNEVSIRWEIIFNVAAWILQVHSELLQGA